MPVTWPRITRAASGLLFPTESSKPLPLGMVAADVVGGAIAAADAFERRPA
jgi:hypothetical protein